METGTLTALKIKAAGTVTLTATQPGWYQLRPCPIDHPYGNFHKVRPDDLLWYDPDQVSGRLSTSSPPQWPAPVLDVSFTSSDSLVAEVQAMT